MLNNIKRLEELERLAMKLKRLDNTYIKPAIVKLNYIPTNSEFLAPSGTRKVKLNLSTSLVLDMIKALKISVNGEISSTKTFIRDYICSKEES